MANQVFVNQKYHETNGNWTNNVIVKTGETADAAIMAAKHQYHAFMSTYGYGETPGNPPKEIDYASCSVEDISGGILVQEVDKRLPGETPAQ